MTRPDPIADHDSAFDRSAVAEAWQAFVEQRPHAAAEVRELIAESWRRSAAGGVPARGAWAPPAGDEQAIGALVRDHRELLTAAEHTWQLLSESLAASDNVFVVASPDGVILDVLGSEEFVAAAAQQHVGPGRDWSEAASGTNAIGTALVLDRPTIVRSTEHYCEAAKIWDCAASPIRDLTDGTLIGVLDVTSVGDLSDSHTLALAVTAAHQIEHTLHAQELARSVQLLNWYRSEAPRWHDRQALLLDRKGRIVRSNEAAQDVIAANALTITMRGGKPDLDDAQPARLVKTVPYHPPAELANDGDASAWHGGVAIIESRVPAGGQGPAAGRADRARLHSAFERIATADPAMIALMRQAERMARANSPILLNGETGSGKELFARAVHESSAVADHAFVAVNCGTLTRELAASELLGYEAGAFTGASAKGRRGKFEEADGGTLFLDEIGELPPDVQVHLLRVLQDNVVVRVGGNLERHVNVRIIAATHRDLERDAADGRFRSDLLFRLRVLSLNLPPLRERRADLGLLIARYLQRLQATYGLGAKTVSPDLLELLGRYSWPGNVRELHGLLESMYILSDRALLTPAELPDGFVIDGGLAARSASPARLNDVERELIVREIARHRHNMSAVARQLGISRSTLYRKIKQYGIDAR